MGFNAFYRDFIPAIATSARNNMAFRSRGLEAKNELARLEQSPGAALPASRIALALSGIGDPERALDALELACDERSRLVVFLGVWPAYDALRE